MVRFPSFVYIIHLASLAWLRFGSDSISFQYIADFIVSSRCLLYGICNVCFLIQLCFKVRGYISFTSLRFAKHRFIWIVLPLSESPCLRETKIFEYINHFLVSLLVRGLACVAWLYSLVEFSLGSYSNHEIVSVTVLYILFIYRIYWGLRTS